MSPLGSTKNQIASSVVPQAIKPSLQAFANKDFFRDSPIVSQKYQGLPPSLQVRPGTSATAQVLGKKFNQSPIQIDAFVKGTLGGIGGQVLHASDVALAGLHIIPKNKISGDSLKQEIIQRFTDDRGGQIEQNVADEIKKIIEKQAGDRFARKQEAEILYADLKKMKPDEANQKAFDIKQKNPQLYDSLKQVIEDTKLGLTYPDRLVKQLNVQNGERAQFIWKEMKSRKAIEDQKAYLYDLEKKKILTNQVLLQLQKLKSTPSVTP